MTHQGYGFCEFLTEEDAEYACKIMNQIKLWGKPIRVNKVRHFLSARMYAGRQGPGASTIQHVALSRAVRPIMSIMHCRVRTICSNGSIVGTPSYAMLCARTAISRKHSNRQNCSICRARCYVFGMCSGLERVLHARAKSLFIHPFCSS